MNMQRRPMQTPSRFIYTPRTQEALTQRNQQYTSGSRDTYFNPVAPIWTPKEGENWVRILPPTWPQPRHYGFDTHIHFSVGPDFLAILCPAKMKGERCLVCEERARFAAMGHEQTASDLRPTFRLMTYIVDRKEPQKGAQVWLMPMSIDRELVGLCQDSRTGEVLWLDDPDRGYDIEFRRTGTGVQTKYMATRVARNPSPLEHAEALAFAVSHPLPDLLRYASDDVVAQALSGVKPEQGGRDEPSGSAAPRAPAAPVEGTGRFPERRPAPAPAQPSVSFEEQYNVALEAMATCGIEIPDTVPDQELPRAVARALGENISRYPTLRPLL